MSPFLSFQGLCLWHLTFLSVAWFFLQWLLSNPSHCSLLKVAPSKQLPCRVLVNPYASPSSSSFFFSNNGAKLFQVAWVPNFPAYLTLNVLVGSPISEVPAPPYCSVPDLPQPDGYPGCSLHKLQSESLLVKPILLLKPWSVFLDILYKIPSCSMFCRVHGLQNIITNYLMFGS